MARNPFLGSILLLCGIICGLHGAMGMNQFKHWISIHDDISHDYHKSILNIPKDIVFESIVGLSIILFSIILLSKPFKEIINSRESRLRLFDSLFYCEDFMVFKHRKHPINAGKQ